MSKSYKNRSGVTMAALGRNSAGPMRHRLTPRGGSQKLDLDDDGDDEIEVPFYDREPNDERNFPED